MLRILFFSRYRKTMLSEPGMSDLQKMKEVLQTYIDYSMM